jgi:hypothetical protein
LLKSETERVRNFFRAALVGLLSIDPIQIKKITDRVFLNLWNQSLVKFWSVDIRLKYWIEMTYPQNIMSARLSLAFQRVLVVKELASGFD